MTIEQQPNEQESLLIIQQMIGRAKQENKDDGKGWILWGWLLFGASIFSFINSELKITSQYFFWNSFGIIGSCFFLYQAIKYFLIKPRTRVKTYTGDLLRRLNIGFFISLFLLMIAMNFSIDPVAGFAILINLYGFWLLIYGTALNFKPFTIGAFVNWILAMIALFVHSFDKIMLIHAAAVLCGYIIPGHLANNEFRKAKRVVLINQDYSV
jgi:hypothetical protein